MNGITPLPPAGPKHLANPFAAQATASTSLLAPPQTISTGGLDDAMSMLYVAFMNQNNSQLQAGANRVEANKAAGLEQLKKETEARLRENKLEDAGSGLFASLGKIIKDVVHDFATLHIGDAFSDAAKDTGTMLNSPQFWKDLECGASKIAEVAAVVGSVAIAAVTCGAAAPGAVAVIVAVAGATLSTAGCVQSEFHVLEKLGVDKGTAGYLGMGLTCAGAVCSAGLGLAGGASAAAASTAARTGTAMSAAGAGADVVGGSAHVVVSRYEAGAQDAKADVQDAENKQRWLHKIVDNILGDLREINKAGEKKLQTLRGAIETADHTGLATASMRA